MIIPLYVEFLHTLVYGSANGSFVIVGISAVDVTVSLLQGQQNGLGGRYRFVRLESVKGANAQNWHLLPIVKRQHLHDLR